MSDLVIAYSRFADTVKPGNPDRIWLGPLRVLHGGEKHTAAEWLALIEQLKLRPVAR